MKKTILTLLVASMAFAAMARPVDKADAARVANHFWASALGGKGVLTQTPWQYAEVYLFVGEAGGFVLVAADDCTSPVLGYSLSSSLRPDALPLPMAERLEAYCEQIALGIEMQVEATEADAARWKALRAGDPCKDGDGDDRVDPLLETHWHQDGGYALLTPQHLPVGCAATAQGQMMRYWRYPAFGRGRATYNCQPYGAQTADYAHTLYDWDNMPDQVLTTNPMEEQLAVSTLLYHIGVSLHMGYAPGGSGAAGLVGQPGIPSIDNSLRDYFYYSPSLHPIFKTSGYTDQRWADSLKAELRLQHPIVYCGVAPEGGHGFVCDGYEYRDAQIWFHFNFGWSGAGDGYYTVDDICPNVSPTGQIGNTYHFTQSNQALIGAVPDYGPHVSDTLRWMDREGGVDSVLFAGNALLDSPWTVSSSDSWLHVDAQPGANAQWVTFSVDPNTSGSERTATLTFTHGDRTVTVGVVQTYYAVGDYCPLTVVMESTRGGGWEGGAYLSFESLSGYVYATATLEFGSSETTTVMVAPHDVNVVFHRGGGTDRYINYKVLNQYGEEYVNVEYAFMNGGTHFIEWPCAHVGIGSAADRVRLAVSPNPATDCIRIEAEGMLQADLLNADGRVMATTSQPTLSLAALPAGLYMLRVATREGVAACKIVKQ